MQVCVCVCVCVWVVCVVRADLPEAVGGLAQRPHLLQLQVGQHAEQQGVRQPLQVVVAASAQGQRVGLDPQAEHQPHLAWGGGVNLLTWEFVV